MVFNQPLDLYYWLVTLLSGNLTIFLALAMLFIAGMSAMFRLPNIITYIVFIIFVMLLAPYLGAVKIVVVLVTGLILFWSLARLFKT